MNQQFIMSAKRTPIGAFNGSLATVSATDLGATVIRSAVEAAQLDSKKINECIMGHVLTAATGQAPARQSALKAGLPTSTACMAINKVCGSGLKAVMLGADSIALGHSQCVVAGGQENMSLSPHLLAKSRTGYRMGDIKVLDSMLADGLIDPYKHYHMGNAAELCAQKYKFSREDQDEFAKTSYQLAQEAQKQGHFTNEITPVEVKTKKVTNSVSEDDEPSKARFDKMSSLRPAFEKEGTITAANASKINDGAAALVIANEELAKNGKPLVRIVGYASFAQEPEWFTTAPIGAIKNALKKTNLKIEDIDLWEINEAFSNVTMAAMTELNIPRKKVNVHGGAVALGHPIGASGARILTTLIHAMKTRQQKLGMASLCIGGGEAVAVIVENM